MKFYGKIEQPEDKTSTKTTKGAQLPDKNDKNHSDGDLYTVISDDEDVLYIKSTSGWVRVLVDGAAIDAGSY